MMDRTTRIRTDGNSPLSQYVNLLVAVPENLERLLERDAEAVRILKAEPTLNEAIRRSDRWYWDRQREKHIGDIVLTPRIWTRRDERRVNMQRGLLAGFWPACRAARYLGWLEPRSGPSLHDQWFRLAINEARQDGTAAVLCTKLDQSKAVYGRLISAARDITQDEGGQTEFQDARLEIRNLVSDLLDWTKSPETSKPNGKTTIDANTNQQQITAGLQTAQQGKQATGIDQAETQAEILAADKQSTKNQETQRHEWLAKAMLLVQDHPDWSNAKIAGEVGKHPSTLSRCQAYQSAAGMARASKSDRHKGHITINPETGQQSIEAYSDDPAEQDWDV